MILVYIFCISLFIGGIKMISVMYISAFMFSLLGVLVCWSDFLCYQPLADEEKGSQNQSSFLSMSDTACSFDSGTPLAK